MAIYDDSERDDSLGGFSLPELDSFDDLPLPEPAESSRGESVDGSDFRDDFSELRDGLGVSEEDVVGEVDSESGFDDSADSEPEPKSIYDEVVEHPDYLNYSVEDDEVESPSDDLADAEALKAMFRAEAASGGELPDSFEVTKEPTPADLFNLDQVIADAIDEGASDIHISPDDYTAFSILGAIERKPQYGMVNGFITEGLQQSILTHVLEANFVERLELDTSYVLSETHHAGRRCRLSVGKTFGDIFMVFRVISDNIPSPEDLGVSEELREWGRLPNGLIMVNGPTGTGKALTLSTLIPTPDGVRELREIKEGDCVFDSKHNAVRVTGLSPIDDSPELYRVTLSDGQVILADANHQWIVSTHSSRDAVRNKGYIRLRAKKDSMLEIAATLDSASLGVDNACAQEIHEFIAKFGAHKAFRRVDSLQGVFRFMDTPYVGTRYSGKLYDTKRALADLAARIRQRYEYEDASPLRVMTTSEMIDEGVKTAYSGSNFGIPVATDEGLNEDIALPIDRDERRSSSNWIYVRSIERVDPDDSDYESVRCISVDSEDRSYLCADHVVTHNSTTLASLLNASIQERAQKIITIERPIEYVFANTGKGFVTQREVGPDSRGFSSALDSAMRQAPDIIMIGESRNREEIDQVLRAAETGHLTFTTMHTNSAAATINRIKSLFDGSEQGRILSTLSDVARGFANQVLVPTVDGSSRFAIREVLPFTEEVSALVADADVKGIRNFQIENHITMEDGLVKAVVDGRCTLEAAKSQSAYPHMFDQMIKDLG